MKAILRRLDGPTVGHVDGEKTTISKHDEFLRKLDIRFYDMHNAIWDAIFSGRAYRYRWAIASCREFAPTSPRELSSYGFKNQ
jgi:hypothetical protein